MQAFVGSGGAGLICIVNCTGRCEASHPPIAIVSAAATPTVSVARLMLPLSAARARTGKRTTRERPHGAADNDTLMARAAQCSQDEVGGIVFGIIRPCRHQLGSELSA